MATAPATKLMTADEFYEFCNRPENAGKHFELERGEVVEVSRPGSKHCHVCTNITRILSNFTFAVGEGMVFCNDAGIVWERDPDTVRGPDISYYDRTTEYDQLNPKYLEEPPVLAVEVVSPNDRPNRINRRVQQFLGWGTRAVWLLDPDDRTLAVHRAGQLTVTLDGNDELAGDPEIPGFRCRVADFFAVPRKSPVTPPPPGPGGA